MKHLIVTADDFGLAPEVNEAVAETHEHGILSAASLMVGAPAASQAVDLARRLPRLRVGLHLALVDARPLLPPERIPGLVASDGWFRRDTARLGAEIFVSPALRRQMAAEIEAQFAAFAATGLPLDHVNAHQHFHLHPTLAGLVIRFAQRYSVAWVRVPDEPRRILASIEGDAPGHLGAVTRPWHSLLRARLRRAGLRGPDQVFGLAWTGAMTPARVAALIDRLPPGVTEIYLHPASRGGFRGAAEGYLYVQEKAALLAPGARAALIRSGASLGGFADCLA